MVNKFFISQRSSFEILRYCLRLGMHKQNVININEKETILFFYFVDLSFILEIVIKRIKIQPWLMIAR